MADLDDVRRIAESLPGTSVGTDERGQLRLWVEGRAFVGTWRERVHPKKPKVPRPEVLTMSISDLQEKEFPLASDSRKLFTEPHYDGYATVLVRLSEIGVEELTELLTDAWRTRAPEQLPGS